MGVFDPKILLVASSLSILFPLLTGMICYRNLRGPERVFWVFFLVSTILEAILFWFNENKINNMPFLHLVGLTEVIFISYVFHVNYKSAEWKRVQLYIVYIFIIFAILWPFVSEGNAILEGFDKLKDGDNNGWSLILGGFYKFPTIPRIIESLVLVTFSFSFFNQLAKEEIPPHTSVVKLFMFWVSLGVLFYFTGNFFLFLFYAKIGNSIPHIWSLHNILNIMTNIVFSIAFLCKMK